MFSYYDKNPFYFVPLAVKLNSTPLPRQPKRLDNGHQSGHATNSHWRALIRSLTLWKSVQDARGMNRFSYWKRGKYIFQQARFCFCWNISTVSQSWKGHTGAETKSWKCRRCRRSHETRTCKTVVNQLDWQKGKFWKNVLHAVRTAKPQQGWARTVQTTMCTEYRWWHLGKRIIHWNEMFLVKALKVVNGVKQLLKKRACSKPSCFCLKSIKCTLVQ